MSRPIKFRVWEVENKKMIYLNELFCWENGYHGENFTTFDRRISDTHIDIFSLDNSIWQKEAKKRFILQQFTGLLDKNGKEIYEGDILIGEEWFSSRNPAWIPLRKVQVIYLPGFFALDYGYQKTPIIGNEWYLYRDFEIVGNIFENKD